MFVGGKSICFCGVVLRLCLSNRFIAFAAVFVSGSILRLCSLSSEIGVGRRKRIDVIINHFQMNVHGKTRSYKNRCCNWEDS